MEKETHKPCYTMPTGDVFYVRVERGFAGSGFSSNSSSQDGTDGFDTRDDLSYGNDLFT